MADRRTTLDELREAFARMTRTEARDWFPVFKARYGMREVFRAAADVHGAGQVVTTLFTGCTAVDSIFSAGLAARYDAIDPATLTVDVRALSLDESVRAVIIQNSYGIIDERASAEAAAKAHDAGALFMEDSAHCVTRMARDAEGHPLADVSIHSLGIEKQFLHRFGGLVWVSPDMPDVALRERIVSVLGSLPEPPARLSRNARRYRTQNRVLAHLPGSLGPALRTWLTSSGGLEPPVAAVEQRGELPYPSYLPSDEIAHRIPSPPSPASTTTRPCGTLGRRLRRRPRGRGPALHPPGGARGGPHPAPHPLPDSPLRRAARPRPHRRPPLSRVLLRGLVPGALLPGGGDRALRLWRLGGRPGLPRLQHLQGIVGLPTDLDPSRMAEALEIVRGHLS